MLSLQETGEEREEREGEREGRGEGEGEGGRNSRNKVKGDREKDRHLGNICSAFIKFSEGGKCSVCSFLEEGIS